MTGGEQGGGAAPAAAPVLVPTNTPTEASPPPTNTPEPPTPEPTATGRSAAANGDLHARAAYAGTANAYAGDSDGDAYTGAAAGRRRPAQTRFSHFAGR